MNIERRSARTAVRWMAGITAVAVLSISQFSAAVVARPQAERLHENMQGVLSRRPLKPPLRNAKVAVRFSPDGSSLTVQDPSGVYLLSQQPLALRAYFSAENLYPAQFSFDSQSITSVGYGLEMHREKVPGGEHVEQGELPFDNGCIDAQLSPGGDDFACLTPEYKLLIYEFSSKQLIFSESLADRSSPNRILWASLDREMAFSGPFGYRWDDDWQFLAGKGKHILPVSFSPDGKVLVVRTNLQMFRIDLATHQKSALPGAVRKEGNRPFCMLDADHLLFGRDEKESQPVLFSLKSGDVTARLSFKADSIRPASNSRYVILTDTDVTGERIFDLQENRELDTPENASVDVFKNEIAALNSNGTLFLYHFGERLPFASVDLPVGEFPTLRAAVVTPGLDRMAISLESNGAVYDIASGQLLSSTPGFYAASFSDPSALYFASPRQGQNPYSVNRLEASSGKSELEWQGAKAVKTSNKNLSRWLDSLDSSHAGGAVFFEYTLQLFPGYGETTRFAISPNNIPYLLRALDPATGKELWKRDYFEHCPVPFADPQGDRLVLAWDANASEAEGVAKHIPSAWPIFKRAKRSKLDTFFEVVDGRSGATTAGALVQQGSGPYSFDAAYSVGNALFLIKDEKRVSLYSLQDGSLIGKFVGVLSAANAQSGLFALEETLGRVSVYDLATGTKLGDHNFMNPIAYIHFSADGSRIFVLTKHQIAYVLNASFFRHSGESGAPAPPSH